MSTPVQSTPPPPPSGSSSSIHSGNSRNVSHPSWNSFVSDITMSDEEQHRHYQHYPPTSTSSSNNNDGNGNGKNSNQNHPLEENYYRAPLQRNEDGNASLFEYSQSSEEAYGPHPHPHHRHHHNHHHRESTNNTSGSGLFGSATSTGFRFRNDITTSSRVVQFETSSDDDDDDHSTSGASSARQEAAEEGAGIFRHKPPPNGNHHNQQQLQQQQHRHHHKNNKHRNKQQHHRDGGAAAPKVNRDTFLATPNRWVTQLAYSFRSPEQSKRKKSEAATNKGTKKVELSSSKKQALSKIPNNRRNDKNSSNKKATKAQQQQPRTTALDSARQKQQLQQEQTQPTTLTVPAPTAKVPVGSNNNNKSEHSPLLPPSYQEEQEEAAEESTFPQQQYHQISQHGHRKLYATAHRHRHPYDYISMAVAFLQDYEAARPPTLASNVTWITPFHMSLFHIKYSTGYGILLCSATLALFLSSCLEGPSPTDSTTRMHILSGLNLYALVIFAMDMWIRNQFDKHYAESPTGGGSGSSTTKSKNTASSLVAVPMQSRTSHANLLMRPLCLFGLFLGLENLGWLLARPDRTFVVLYSSIWKPIVLYYISSTARHAMEALLRIAKIVSRVLLIEMVLILSFAAVACRLFNDFEPFQHLSVSWLSLFKLGTTVVNPSIWMPMYEATHWSAIYFVLFIVVTVFYMHSLVLSVVFQTYIQAATEIHDRSITDREDAIQLAYAALKRQQQLDSRKQQSQKKQTGAKESILSSLPASPGGIPMYLVRETLEGLRPHYNAMKINALLEIFDSANAKDVDFTTFRTKIRQALNASVRTARIASPLAVSIELTAVIVAVLNFLYVIMLTSSFSTWWFDAIELHLGALITIAGLVELVMRTNPMRLPNFTPMTRFNSTFDGLAMLAALISCAGIVLSLFHHPHALEYILMGRAIDMIRVMRFFQIFRDVVRRSSDVLPALLGPLTLIATMLHIFVYVGIAFWGGAIEVGTIKDITPLYDLNNFNSYLEGLVTMFQVLVVNDWHAIAEVFLHADRCSNPEIVYPFFILGNLIGVSILINVVTAFFVESFVTKLSTGDRNQPETSVAAQMKDFSIKTSENSSARRVTSSNNIPQMAAGDDESDAHDADSEGSSDSELFEFDVYEREGYDRIIQTVTGGQHQDDFARQVCKHFELFESLSPGREKVGYLVCCQQTMNRYGNRRFETEAEDFVDKLEFHSLVTEMHAELLLLSTKESFDDRSLLRTYPSKTDPKKTLEISATILRQHPALTLFVSRIVVP